VTGQVFGGGGGTDGDGNSPGGNGYAVSLSNLVTGSTTGTLFLKQDALGGAGGQGYGTGSAGVAGTAYSLLSFSSTGSPSSSSFSANTFANGGNGGGAQNAPGGAAGAGQSTASVTGNAPTITVTAYANYYFSGNYGGNVSGNSTAETAGAGGNGTASATGTGTGANTMVYVNAYGQGGIGGNNQTLGNGGGGAAGTATATGTPTSAGQVILLASAPGGNGGYGSGATYTGGTGGNATSTVNDHSPWGNLNDNSSASGGSGGIANGPAAAGNGGSATAIINVGSFIFQQTASPSGQSGGAAQITIIGGTVTPTHSNTGTFTLSGTLDLVKNPIYIDYGTEPDPMATVKSLIVSAYNSGAWTGAGITSSYVEAHSSSYAIGYADVTDPGNPAGLPAKTLEAKPTLLGDALLTGTVGLGDYNAVIANLNTGTLWTQAAFHYGQATGLGDYNDVLANFNQTDFSAVIVSPSVRTESVTFTPNAATDLKLEVNTITGDVYALATATTALTGYDIFDKSGNLLDSGDPNTDLNERLLSQPSSTTLGNQTTFRNATNYKLWATILDNTSTLAEGSNNGKLKQGTASTYDTINIPANGTIDFGDIYSTVAHNNDITFAFSEADPTNAGNPVTGSTYNGEVDYVGNTVMPEPGVLGLLGLGGIMMMRRRRTRP